MSDLLRKGDPRIARMLGMRQFAAAKGQLDVCRLLVEYGAEVYTNPMNTYAPVLQAAWHKHADVVKYFLEEIPDKAAGTNGSALHGAAAIVAVAPLAVLFGAIFLIPEQPARIDLAALRLSFRSLLAAFKKRELWIVGLFLFLYNFNPGFGTPPAEEIPNWHVEWNDETHCLCVVPQARHGSTGAHQARYPSGATFGASGRRTTMTMASNIETTRSTSPSATPIRSRRCATRRSQKATARTSLASPPATAEAPGRTLVPLPTRPSSSCSRRSKPT